MYFFSNAAILTLSNKAISVCELYLMVLIQFVISVDTSWPETFELSFGRNTSPEMPHLGNLINLN